MSEYLELRTSAALNEIAVLNELLEVAARALRIDPALRHDLTLAVAELVANVVEHELKGGPGEVTVRLERRPGELLLTLNSAGPPFDLDAILASAAARDPLAELDGSGLGLPLLAALFDGIEQSWTEGEGNRIALRRKR
ncbi:MAG: ATP-binding protein [Planctomycetota bacterium]